MTDPFTPSGNRFRPDPIFAEARDMARAGGEYRHEGPGHPNMPTPNVDTLRRYFSDPAFAAQYDAERNAWRASTNALIDEGVRKARESRRA